MTALNGDTHWNRVWLELTSDLAGKDEQTQVLRTRNKQPIDDDTWAHTLRTVASQMELGPQDRLLDLCCGNGLFTLGFAPLVDTIHAVDISPQLIAALRARNLANVTAHVSNLCEWQAPEAAFSKVLWYAGIQYFPEAEIVVLLRRIRQWMRPGGMLFIGDIPDRDKLWDYFNTSERQAAYFDGIARGQRIIGSWLERRWLEQLCRAAGFVDARAVPQDPRLIYADFRFDLLAST